MARDHRPSGRAALRLALLAVLSFPVASFAQGAGAYVTLVDRYRRDDAAGAVAELARWSSERISAAIDEWLRVVSDRERRATDRPRSLVMFRAAAMMHTDLAYVRLMSGLTPRASDQLGHAGRLVGVLIAGSHGAEPAAAFAIRWYAFAASLWTTHGDLTIADRMVREGLAAFPRAAEIYVARGCIQEIRASMLEGDRLRRGIRDNRATMPTGRLLESAAADYQRALDLDGRFTAARLRIGRVHYLLFDARATRDLETALADAADADVRYLAHLFLGADFERRSDFDAARREYEAARALGPYQSSYVALAQVNSALGRGDAARALALEYAKIADKQEDPWWNYRLGFSGSTLSWLRQEARRP